jgi:hypothetical protein
MDLPLDRATAEYALTEKMAEKVGGHELDPFVRKAYDELNKPENEHPNFIVFGNCKTETDRLVTRAKQLRASKKPPRIAH